MKRGKDEEKEVGPMFPRLHVNDTEKGGPRAPPRNKMALYEQFSIPSQRFNPGVSAKTTPPPSSSQGTGPERNYAFPVHLPPHAPTHRAEKIISRQSDVANGNASLLRLEQRKKLDDDDFRVPVYVHSRIGHSNNNFFGSLGGKKLTPTGSRYSGSSVAGKSDCERDPKQFGFLRVNQRKDGRSETEGVPQVSPAKEQPLISNRNISLTGENVNMLAWQSKVNPNQEFQDSSVSKLGRLRQGDACLQRECGAGSQSNDIGHGGDGLVEFTRKRERVNTPTTNQSSPAEAINENEYRDTRTGRAIQKGNLNKRDNVSKISMVEDLPTVKISPDDVVGIIGQKHFWKARREISNQQRVFAVQVFELHRLIKVQQLIAGSPDLLVEERAFLGRSPPKGSTLKKLPLEYVVKPRQQNLKRKDDSEKLNHNKMECSAENAVGKTSLSSVKNGSHHPSSYTPFAGNPYQVNAAADSGGMGPWCFNQSPGQQWLIPVMSPSEGLVYKPYPTPGFTGFGPAPFMSPGHGVPTSHQGIGVPSETPPGSHAYFPPYGMPPVMTAAMSESAVEQANQFSEQGYHRQTGHSPAVENNLNTKKRSSSHRQTGHSLGVETNLNTKNRISSNLPAPRNGAKYQAPSREVELQGSTASSPSEMAQGRTNGGRDTLSLFPMAPEATEEVPQSVETGQQNRAIKVVPHNRRTATESAARIFQSIQEGRKQ